MEAILQINPLVLVLLALWLIPWKGVALWKSARFGQRNWFIALLVLNTLALLDIFYIFVIAKNKKVEVAKPSSSEITKKD